MNGDSVGNNICNFRRMTHSFITFLFASLFLILTGCGEGKRVQTSGEGTGIYEADFRAWERLSHAQQKEEYIQNRWLLRIPQEFVMSHMGNNGVPGTAHPASGLNQRNAYMVQLRGIMDPDSGTISSYPHREDPLSVENEIIIRLQNNRLNTSIREFGFCETPTERKRRFDKCATTTSAPPYMCRLYLNKDGWSVNMSIDRRLMNNTEFVCQSVDRFLSSMTVRGDIK